MAKRLRFNKDSPLSAPQKAKNIERVLRIAVVEDDQLFRLYLKKVLSMEHSGFVITGFYESAESALDPILEARPDVVLVDLGLPNMSGEEVIRQLSVKLIATAFLVLTTHEEPKHVFHSLRAGAIGYCLKSAKPAELVDIIRAAGNGGSPLSPNIARMLIETYQDSSKVKKKKDFDLTRRELQIVELLAQGKVSKEIAHELTLSYETIRDYLKAIFRKLKVQTQTEAVIKYMQSTE